MRTIFLFFVFFGAVLTACDDGRIHEKEYEPTGEGRTVELTGVISGIAKWSDDYSVVIAGFDASSPYAIVSKTIPAPEKEGREIQLTMSGITEKVATVELCVIDKLRKRILSFKEVDCKAETGDTIRIKADKVDAGMFHAIQTIVFNADCISCHGKSNEAAAGLWLTEGKSYVSLVNQPSKANPDMLRVKPRQLQESLLHLVLKENGHVRHDHVDLLSAKPEKLELIDSWILNEAQE